MTRWRLAWVLAYVITVLVVDTLATQRVHFLIDWQWLRPWPADVAAWLWQLGVPNDAIAWLRDAAIQRVEVFDVLFWFLLPLLLCLRGMDWGALGLRRITRNDWLLLAGIAAAGFAAMWVIPQVPSLENYYSSLAYYSDEQKWDYAARNILWVLSWLIGWEFLHRYVLLRGALVHFPRWGWLLVPLSEGIYHLQKPPLEAAAMVVFSLFLTRWAMRRNAILAPFLAHFIIEVDLLIFRLFV